MAIPELVGHDIALVNLLNEFFFSVGFGNVHESGGERVIGDECGAEACYRENANVVQCSHWAENKNEEHRAKNEGRHAHGLADFAIREQ